MTGKHYRWQTRWTIDLGACTARHESGLVVCFSQAADTPGAWDGELLEDPALTAQLVRKHGPHNIGPMVARLMREAAQLYTEALNARH